MPIPTASPTPGSDTAGIGAFWVHSASVETYQGTGAAGDTYGSPVSFACFIDDSAKLVRNRVGDEVVSSTTIYADLSWAVSLIAESRVTANGRVAQVITADVHDSGPLGLPDHVEVHLT